MFPLRKPKTVHHMHHFDPFKRRNRCKWCTQCTILPQNCPVVTVFGAPDAPFEAILSGINVRMVHHMHHSVLFFLRGLSKWNTSCTIPHRAVQDRLRIGAPRTPISWFFARQLSQTVHHMHQGSVHSLQPIPNLRSDYSQQTTSSRQTSRVPPALDRGII